MRRMHAFTLIELLVVIAIIALLLSIMMPSLAKAKELARATGCKMHMKNLGLALALYQAQNNEYIVPSYNMTGTQGGDASPLDGWGPILDRDGLVGGTKELSGSSFLCQSIADIDAVGAGRGTDPNNAKGWMYWPCIRYSDRNEPVPEANLWGGFHTIRQGYWINADNPIGGVKSVVPDTYYTASVGYGPGSNGLYIRNTNASVFTQPGKLIALADGIYAGRQSNSRPGDSNCRVGWRHGNGDTANVALADGHCDSIRGDMFPTTDAPGPYSVYAKPSK